MLCTAVVSIVLLSMYRHYNSCAHEVAVMHLQEQTMSARTDAHDYDYQL